MVPVRSVFEQLSRLVGRALALGEAASMLLAQVVTIASIVLIGAVGTKVLARWNSVNGAL